MYLTRYLYYCMKLKQEEIYDRQQGTGQPHIYISHIKNFPIPKIPVEEQHKILDTLELDHQKLIESREKVVSAEMEVTKFLRSIYSGNNPHFLEQNIK